MLLPTSSRGLRPRDAAAGLEARPRLSAGAGERYTGYGVLGVTFESGDVLALRRYAATSIGPAYTSVWHRTPDGRWTLYQNLDRDAGCGRYFSSAADVVTTGIRIVWGGADHFAVIVEAERPLAWRLALRSTRLSRAVGRPGARPGMGSRAAPLFARACAAAAGALLGTGALAGAAITPNGYSFESRPSGLWLVRDSAAALDGRPLGTPVRRPSRLRLGTIEIPRRGLFATMDVVVRRTAVRG